MGAWHTDSLYCIHDEQTIPASERNKTHNLTFNMLKNIMSPPPQESKEENIIYHDIRDYLNVDEDVRCASAHTESHAFPVSACCTLYAVNES